MDNIFTNPNAFTWRRLVIASVFQVIAQDPAMTP